MLHGSGQHVGDGLNAAVRMPRKTGKIVLWNVVAKVVEQQERIELFGVAETECAAQMDAGAFHGWLRLNESFNRP